MQELFGGRARWVAAGLLLGLVSGCAGTTSERDVRAALAAYDPDEVQMLRDNAKDNGFEVDDALLLSTLRFREGCRLIATGLADLAAGVASDQVADDLGALTQIARDDGQSDLADA